MSQSSFLDTDFFMETDISSSYTSFYLLQLKNRTQAHLFNSVHLLLLDLFSERRRDDSSLDVPMVTDRDGDVQSSRHELSPPLSKTHLSFATAGRGVHRYKTAPCQHLTSLLNALQCSWFMGRCVMCNMLSSILVDLAITSWPKVPIVGWGRSSLSKSTHTPYLT